MRFNFCDSCGSFEYTKLINEKNICNNCLNADNKYALPKKEVKVFEKEQESFLSNIAVKEKDKEIILTGIEQKNELIKRSYKIETITFLEKLKSFITNNINVYTVKEFCEHLNIPRSNVEQSIYQLKKQGLLFSRPVFNQFKQERFTIYSSSKDSVNAWQFYELQVFIKSVLKMATVPMSTIELADKMNCRKSSVVKSVNRHLCNCVIVYSADNENFFVLKDSVAHKNIYFHLPTAKKLKSKYQNKLS
ncbi:MAG: hypothetical protein HC907_17855 [Richelia sp. SM1_7_0]|nr:hypothetical protein [Richelia sp. SM1_7_0]